ncbi:MAG: 6-phosphogluconolactonase [Deltaproteobacteria bacterium]|nr:6-phosphogluconolactonase [Deltaproteobacteria bacterium]
MVSSTQVELNIFQDLDDLSRQTATRFAGFARDAVRMEGRFTVALSGGSTPQLTYSLLAQEALRSQIPWDAIHIFWGDERCVPLERPDNHFTMTTELLLSKVPIPEGNVRRMRGEAANPHEAAPEYEGSLREFFGLGPTGIPRFDLILLGMGADGHTASLFPGSPGLEERDKLVVAHYVPKVGMNRLTLTYPVLNNARVIMFLAAGNEKAEALKSVLADDTCGPILPARLVKPVEGEVIWMVDRAAARLLDR